MSAQVETRTATASVAEYLSRDHDAIDALLDEVVRSVEDGELERAESTFAEFDRAMARHIEIEEEILFPLFETRHGSGRHPVDVMTVEHRFLQRCLAKMRETLTRGDGRGFLAANEEFIGELATHNLKEERFLYPAIDEALTPGEREAMVHRLSRPRLIIR